MIAAMIVKVNESDASVTEMVGKLKVMFTVRPSLLEVTNSSLADDELLATETRYA